MLILVNKTQPQFLFEGDFVFNPLAQVSPPSSPLELLLSPSKYLDVSDVIMGFEVPSDFLVLAKENEASWRYLAMFP